jgi:hypothetical protein
VGDRNGIREDVHVLRFLFGGRGDGISIQRCPATISRSLFFRSSLWARPKDPRIPILYLNICYIQKKKKNQKMVRAMGHCLGLRLLTARGGVFTAATAARTFAVRSLSQTANAAVRPPKKKRKKIRRSRLQLLTSPSSKPAAAAADGIGAAAAAAAAVVAAAAVAVSRTNSRFLCLSGCFYKFYKVPGGGDGGAERVRLCFTSARRSAAAERSLRRWPSHSCNSNSDTSVNAVVVSISVQQAAAGNRRRRTH